MASTATRAETVRTVRRDMQEAVNGKCAKAAHGPLAAFPPPKPKPRMSGTNQAPNKELLNECINRTHAVTRSGNGGRASNRLSSLSVFRNSLIIRLT